MKWMDLTLGVFWLAAVPFLLAVYGGHVAADSISDDRKRRNVKLRFGALALLGFIVACVYQYRIMKTDEAKQTEMQQFQQRITEKLDEIIKYPASQAQQQEATKLKRELMNMRPPLSSRPKANGQKVIQIAPPIWKPERANAGFGAGDGAICAASTGPITKRQSLSEASHGGARP